MSQIERFKITNDTFVADIRKQAWFLFIIAMLGISTCIVISSIGATALIMGKTSVGVFTTIASSFSILPFMHMAKTAHNWLKIAKKELQVLHVN